MGGIAGELWRLVGGIDDVQGEVADEECAQRKTAVSERTTSSPAAVARPATAAGVGRPRSGTKDEKVVLDDEARCSDRVSRKRIIQADKRRDDGGRDSRRVKNRIPDQVVFYATMVPRSASS